jgi:hypothetical protein
LRYFLYAYAYGTLKPVEVFLRRGVGEEGRIIEKMRQTRVLYIYISIYI